MEEVSGRLHRGDLKQRGKEGGKEGRREGEKEGENGREGIG